MKWLKYTINTTTEAVDLVSDMLGELGIEGIEIEDNVPLTESDTKGMFIDILPELPPDEGNAKVSFYLDDDTDAEEIEALLDQVRDGLEETALFVNIGAGTIEAGETEDKDWINNWKEFFKPFTVDDILIKPTWEQIPEEHKDKLMIEIDPGTAFGTGSHETTQLCIRQLQKYVTPDVKVLDIGTGSGILGIAALGLGAERVIGVDIDPKAVDVAYENAAMNGAGRDRLTVYAGNVLGDSKLAARLEPGQNQVVLANIVADVIIPLSGAAARFMAPGGVFLTSGIIDSRADEVAAAIEANGFVISRRLERGGWYAFRAEQA